LEVDRKHQGKSRSGSLRDFARLDAGRADFHPARATLGLLHADRLQVWIESSRRAIVRVRDIVAELWSFTADFATFGHFIQPPEFLGFFTGVSGIIRSVILP
jgi:hypothetical protein